MQTKIILELGCNHQGEIDIAKRMIDDAVELGAWCVKLQKRDIESIPESVKTLPRRLDNSFGLTYYEHRKALEFTIDKIYTLKEFTEKAGLKFCVSVFDLRSAMEMISLGVDCIKIPSQLYTDKTINDYIFKNKKNFDYFVSTGMHSFSEIINCEYFDKSDYTFFCRSIYPSELNMLNFLNLKVLKDILKKSELGYSSHEKNGEACHYAVLLGAKIIERHYTLNKGMKGSDHGTVSSDFKEMKQIIFNIEEAEDVIGNGENEICEQEKLIRKVYRGF